MLGFRFVVIITTLFPLAQAIMPGVYLFPQGLTRVSSALYHRMTQLLPYCSPIAPLLHWLSFALQLEMQC
jgi:hypothetical protein